MLRQPGEGLTRRIGLAADMGCRGSVFQHGEVGVVLAGLARIGAQPFDAQIRESETFDLGDVDSGITVDEVGGRAVRLVAGDGTVAVGPGRPLVGEVLKEHVAKCLAVVADDFRIALLQEQEIVLQLIAAPLLEFF